MLILEEHDLEGSVKEEVPEPEEDVAKAKHKKNLVKAKRIIADSIKDHLIPHISSLTTPKQMFDALSRLYEGKNINQKMTLRTQLKSVKMQNSETIQSYFTRVLQIKEQLEAIGDKVEEVELVMTTLMVSQDHGNLSFKEYVLEGSLRSSADCGRIVLRKKQGWQHKKKN